MTGVLGPVLLPREEMVGWEGRGTRGLVRRRWKQWHVDQGGRFCGHNLGAADGLDLGDKGKGNMRYSSLGVFSNWAYKGPSMERGKVAGG